jgi:class 3 adenylate cyclase
VTVVVCPSCGEAIDPDARFCESCGRALVEPCPRCGAETKVGARFCASCGHRLDATPDGSGEERKLVTILFADLTGSTALGEQLDPERLRALLGEYFAAMASVIESWGGVVEKFIGDAVMAVFGIPAAREDDAERALRAALGMQVRLEQLNDEIEERHGVRLAVRIGVNSGEVIAGLSGDQFMVTGDVVNVAARLQQTADPGDVVAGERTYLATRGALRVEPLDDRQLKGKSLPVRAWRVVGTLDLSPVDTDPARGMLVGRSRELALLDTLYQGSVDDGRPALVTIIGHAGVGKSRLTEEFVERTRSGADGPAVLRGRCLAYGDGITFWALREVLWHAAGIAFDDSADLAAAKLEVLVRDLFAESSPAPVEAERVLFALATTAGIVLPENPLDGMSPESIGEELGLAWPRFLTALAARRPAVVVIDDLHRGEPPMLDMIERIVARSEGPLFVVATGRPELAELRIGWSARPGMSRVTLEPLGDSQAEELMRHLAPRVGAGLRRRVLETAEGNPLFVEEILEHLVDQGVLSREHGRIVEVAGDAQVTIPDTVRAVLAARVDALPSDEKRVLQDASVVGRVFWATTLQSMAGAHVEQALATLENKGLVVARPTSSLGGQTEFVFRHGLIREVAYESIPKARRASTHAKVGRWIQDVVRDRREEYVELIAHHLEAAANPEDAELAWPSDPAVRDEVRSEAVAALIEAGRAEAARFAIEQALGFGDRALALASRDEERLAAYELKAYAAEAAVRANDAWESYLEAIAAGERLGRRDEVQRLRAHATLCWARWRGMLTGDLWLQQANDILRRGIEETDDSEASFELGAFLTGRAAFGFWELQDHSPRQARDDARRAVRIAQEVDSEKLLSYSLDVLYGVIVGEGFCESGELADRALDAGRSMADRGEAHELLVTAAIAFAHAGRFDEAANTARDTVALATRLGPHRMLHAGSALTNALLPPGRLAELREATAAAPALVESEGMHTCFHGLAALAAQALTAHEDGDDEAANRALEVLDTVAVSGRVFSPAFATNVVYPLIGPDEARRRLDVADPSGDEARPNVQRLIDRTRLELQLCASTRDWATLAALEGRARSLAESACAPYLAWIVDWARAFELADRGERGEGVSRALAAAASLDAYGERYLGARLLVDLLPVLGESAAGVAERVIPVLDAIGARTSAREAAALVS